jgi:hypothetical protein
VVDPANLRSRHSAQDPTDERSEVGRARWALDYYLWQVRRVRSGYTLDPVSGYPRPRDSALNVERAVCVGSGSSIHAVDRFSTTESAFAAIEEHAYGNGEPMAA